MDFISNKSFNIVVLKHQQGDNYCFNYRLKQLRAKNSSTDPQKHIKAYLGHCYKKWRQVRKPYLSLFFVGGLVDGLSTVSINSLYSTLKAVTRALETKYKKAAFKGDK